MEGGRRAALPARGRGALARGYVIWGVWEPILTAIVDGRLQQVFEAELAEWSMQSAGVAYAVLADGTAAAWAPTEEALFEMP